MLDKEERGCWKAAFLGDTHRKDYMSSPRRLRHFFGNTLGTIAKNLDRTNGIGVPLGAGVI